MVIERGSRAFALDERVGRERRAEYEQPELAGAELRLARESRQAVDHSRFGRLRRGENLGRSIVAARLQHDVGEGAADVHRQTRIGLSLLQFGKCGMPASRPSGNCVRATFNSSASIA